MDAKATVLEQKPQFLVLVICTLSVYAMEWLSTKAKQQKSRILRYYSQMHVGWENVFVRKD